MIELDAGTIELISVIPDILELEGHDLVRHSFAVACLSKALAKELSPKEESELFLAGLVHDIGSFDMSYQDIHRDDIYSKITNRKILSHPLISAQIISSISGLTEVADIIMAHHERCDGQGYPLRRANNEIPQVVQIVRIADSISVKFNHSKALDLEKAFSYLDEQSDKEFQALNLEGAKKAISSEELNNTINDFDLLKKEVDNTILHMKSAVPEAREYSLEDILSFFGQLLDAKHSYSEDHSLRVAKYATLIALALGLESGEIEKIRIAGLLHDIGKLGIPNKILDKPARLSLDEFKVIKGHPDFAVKIIKKISCLKDIMPIIQADQEHWDGGGYPKSLKAQAIPLAARIMLVADAFDAMTSDRAYRKAMSIDDALGELQRCADKDFDPRVIKVASALFKSLNISTPPLEKGF